MKICTVCKIPKTLTWFRRQKGKSLDRASRCKVCDQTARDLRRIKNLDKIRLQEKAAKRKNPAKNRLGTRRSRHRLPIGGFELILELQKSLCAICQQPLPLNEKYATRVDHFHGEICEKYHKDENHGCPNCIRGIICRSCDYNEDPKILRARADYIEKMQNPKNRPLYEPTNHEETMDEEKNTILPSSNIGNVQVPPGTQTVICFLEDDPRCSG